MHFLFLDNVNKPSTIINDSLIEYALRGGSPGSLPGPGGGSRSGSLHRGVRRDRFNDVARFTPGVNAAYRAIPTSEALDNLAIGICTLCFILITLWNFSYMALLRVIIYII